MESRDRDLKRLWIIVVIVVVVLIGSSIAFYFTEYYGPPKEVKVIGNVTLPGNYVFIGVTFIDTVINCSYPPCQWGSDAGPNNNYTVIVPSNQRYGISIAYDLGPKTFINDTVGPYLNVSSSSTPIIILNINCFNKSDYMGSGSYVDCS